MARRHVGLVFAHELLDLRRERRVFRRLFLQPFVFLAIIAFPVVIVQQAQREERATTFDVAVEGDVEAVPGLAGALDRHPFRLQRTDDVARRLAVEAAHIGLVLPPDARERVAAGEPVRIDVLTYLTRDVSDRAGPALGRRLAEVRRAHAERQLAAAGAPASLAAPIRLELDDVATASAEGLRFGVAQAVPTLLVIQLFGLISIAQERLAGAKDKRTLEALLLLPVRRRELLAGIGGAATLVGSTSAVIVFVPLAVVLSSAIARIGRSLSGPVELVVALVVGAVSLAVVLVALGLFLGARASSGTEGSAFVTVVNVAMLGVIGISPFLAEVAASGPILAAPVLGPILWVRDGVAEGVSLASTATVLAGQAVVAGLLLRAAERALDGERSVVRSGGAANLLRGRRR